MLDYQARLRKDIARWLDRGLIDSRIAEALLRDSAGQPKEGTSFGSVLAVMASILIGAALLVFIAANWEGIPRVTRVLALFALIAASYVGGAWLKLRFQGPAVGAGEPSNKEAGRTDRVLPASFIVWHWPALLR